MALGIRMFLTAHGLELDMGVEACIFWVVYCLYSELAQYYQTELSFRFSVGMA